MQESPLSYKVIQTQKYISWDELVDFINWISAKFPNIDWGQVGREGILTPHLELVRKLTRMALSVRFGYWFASKWFGPSQFSMINADVREIGLGQLEIALNLRKDLRPCPQLFQLIGESFALLPKDAFGLREAMIKYQIQDHRTVYLIDYPVHHTIWSKLGYTFKFIFNLRAVLRELARQQEQLNEQHFNILMERTEYKNLIDQFPDGICIHRAGIVQYMNPRMAQYLGCRDSQQLLGSHVLDWTPEHMHDTIKARLAKLTENSKHMNPASEIGIVRQDTSEVVLYEVISMNTVFEGEPAVAVIFRDLSERKILQEQMMLQDRLRSLGQLAAGVGHEINNPLFYLLMKVESLIAEASQKKLVHEQKELAEIHQGLEKIQSIVKELKSFSRGQIDESPTQVDLKAILHSAVGMAKNQIQHRAQLKVSLPDDLPYVDGNESRLGQVFLNLLINAAQAIDPGSADKNEISVEAIANSKSQVIVKIRDTGRGIPPEVRQNLFKPFYTTKPIGEGTGLGLSISQSILSRYGGQISFETQVGKGTVFQVSLPASELQPAKLPQFQGRCNLSGLSGRVLLIDDDEELLSVLEDVVSSEHQVFAFQDARKALGFVAKDSQFDCVVCDLMMPNMDGSEFYQELRLTAPELCKKIVFMTGGSFTEKTDKFLSRAQIRYREKPINSDELLDLISQVVSESKQQRELQCEA